MSFYSHIYCEHSKCISKLEQTKESLSTNFDMILDNIDKAILQVEEAQSEAEIDVLFDNLRDSLKKAKPIKACTDQLSSLYKSLSVVSKTHSNIINEQHRSLVTHEEEGQEPSPAIENFKFSQDCIERIAASNTGQQDLPIFIKENEKHIESIVYQWLLTNNYHKSAKEFASLTSHEQQTHCIKYIQKLTEVILIIDDNKFDLEFPFSYILQNKPFFDEVKSDVCFQVIKHKITELIRDRKFTPAYEFMQSQLMNYSDHQVEIEQLFGLLILAQSTDEPTNLPIPQINLYSFHITRENLRKKVTVDICKQMGSPLPDSLKICVLGGILMLRNYLDSLEHLLEIDDKDNLTLNTGKLGSHLESSLGERFIFHSLYICPITKEFCDSTNPPVVLSCGHVISTESMKSLSGSIARNKKFKCPYCPVNMKIENCKSIKI